MTSIPEEIRTRAAAIRLAAFDVDGVLTDGTVWVGADGHEAFKGFNILDGLGLKLLRENGIEVALVTARESPMVAARARDLGLRHVYQGQRDKLDCLTHLCRALSIGLDAVAYAGDDLLDLAALRAVGLSISVPNGHDWVRERVHWLTRRAGGAGAVREVCDLLLEAQGKADAVLRRFVPD